MARQKYIEKRALQQLLMLASWSDKLFNWRGTIPSKQVEGLTNTLSSWDKERAPALAYSRYKVDPVPLRGTSPSPFPSQEKLWNMMNATIAEFTWHFCTKLKYHKNKTADGNNFEKPLIWLKGFYALTRCKCNSCKCCRIRFSRTATSHHSMEMHTNCNCTCAGHFF